MDESVDPEVALSPATLAALKSFLQEKEAAKQHDLDEMNSQKLQPRLNMSENWQLSQFWYDEATCQRLGQEILFLGKEIHMKSNEQVNVACLSCPSIYKALVAIEFPAYMNVYIFEIDERFSVFGSSFVHYDFNKATELPPFLLRTTDIIALDPPFLNKDTLSCFARSVFALRRSNEVKILHCSGRVMCKPTRVLLGCRPCKLPIKHQDGRLSNPFALFVNYDADNERLGGYDTELESCSE